MVNVILVIWCLLVKKNNAVDFYHLKQRLGFESGGF